MSSENRIKDEYYNKKHEDYTMDDCQEKIGMGASCWPLAVWRR
jgi:hypothetical protein